MELPGIAAIQHALRDIDSSSRDVRFVVNVRNAIDRAAVNAHPQLNVRMISQCLTNLQSASHWLFRVAKKKERHPVACWHSDEFTFGLRRPKTFCGANDLIQFLQQI